MFGVPTWKEDEKNRGPQFEELCKTIKGPVLEDTIGNHDGDVKLEDIDVALEQGLGLVGHGDLRVVMLVDEKLETIVSRNKRVIEKFESVDEVVIMGRLSINERVQRIFSRSRRGAIIM